MLVLRHQQQCLSQVILFGTLEVPPEELMEPTLRRIDRLLDDERFLEPVARALAQRRPQSRRLGRPGTPAETVLRLMALRAVRQWGWERLVWEVKGNIVYRRFCRIDGHKVPGAKALIKLNKLLGPEVMRPILDATVAVAVEQGVTRGRRMRLDTTVVEAPIRHPLDNRLLEDGVRVLSRGVRQLQKAGVVLGFHFANVKRSVSRAMRSLASALTRKTREARHAAIVAPYRKLLAVTRRVARQAAATTAVARDQRGALSQHAAGRVRRLVDYLQVMLERVRQVVRQTRARLLGHDTRSRGKIVSIFEPWVEILRRGKRHRPTEFGKLVRVQESEGGIVTDIGIASAKADAPLLLPGVEHHRRLFGRAPGLVSTDRGFYSAKSEKALQQMGVRHPVMPKPGHRTEKRRAHERQRWFVRGRAWRAGGEARIGYLKNVFGMRRSRARGEAGLEQTTLLAAIANNLMTLGRAT